MPELKLYTVAQLREWLEHNHAVEGLSEQIIAPARAWAIIHNPYVKDDDAIVSVIFEKGQLAAYTASFPEMIEGKRIWWCSTLYCYPQFAGRGYGMIVVGALQEAHEPELTYDRWGAQETVEIFKCLGSQTAYTKRYYLGDGIINRLCFLGKIAYAKQECIKWWHRRSLHQSNCPYSLRYLTHIDDITYAFICQYRNNDLFLHEQVMLNWELQYPFVNSCPLIERVPNDTVFSSNVLSSQFVAVQVWNDKELCGFYIIKFGGNSLHVKYLYYDESHKVNVYASIHDHIVSMHITNVKTENRDLADYLRQRIYFPKYHEEDISFSYPMNVLLPNVYSMQYGDGDSFA